MRLLIAGGGTGGHLFPAIAIGKEFLRSDEKNEVLFVGTKKGLESKILKKEGFDLECINVQPIAGRGLAGKLGAMFQLPFSLFESFAIIKRFKPDFVLGVGGYSSGPVTLGAKMMRIKTGIQEQNILPGITNRILGKFVDAVFLAFEEARGFFRAKKVHVTGNPIRESLFNTDATDALEHFGLEKNRFTIFAFGGSLGAGSINRALIGSLEKLAALRGKIQFIHQTGEKDEAIVQEGYVKAGLKAHVAAFIHEMNYAYKVADLVICRAGATSISELSALGKASILVPYPFAAGDHQRANANILEEKNAAIMIEDRKLDGKLADAILEIYGDSDRLMELENNIIQVRKLNAAYEIVRIIRRLAGGINNVSKG